MKHVLISSLLLLFGLAVARAGVGAAAESGSGVVTGVVIGPDDKPVPHAVVTYQSGGGSAPHVAHADARGHFTISKLRSDNYALRASGKGVSSAWENVVVRSGKNQDIDAAHDLRERSAQGVYRRRAPTNPTTSNALGSFRQ